MPLVWCHFSLQPIRLYRVSCQIYIHHLLLKYLQLSNAIYLPYLEQPRTLKSRLGLIARSTNQDLRAH